MRWLLLLALIPVLSMASTASKPSISAPTAMEVEIVRVQAAMKASAEGRDVDALYSHILSNGTIIEGGRLRGREDALIATRRGFESLASITYDYTHTSITPLSATSALWVADGASKATLADGRVISTEFAESIVFEKHEGAWKVLHAHRSTPNPR